MAAMAAHFLVTVEMVLPVAMVAMQAKLVMAVTVASVPLE